MTSFNVLAPELDLSHHYLLEASAGTGKTFSIENIILRLLIEGPESLTLDQILAVTFTRAAVADMKLRVRENLRQALDICKQHLQGKELKKTHEFLRVQLAQGEEASLTVKRKLEQALASFDQAGIYTIHAFCSRMLRENMLEGNNFVDINDGNEDLSHAKLEQIAKDYLRTELRPQLISEQQLEILLNGQKGLDALIKNLGYAITSIVPFAPSHNYEELFCLFVKGMQHLRDSLHVKGDQLLEDFKVLAPNYREVCNNKKEIKPELLAVAEAFCAFFDKQEYGPDDFSFFIEHKGFWGVTLDEEKKRVKTKPCSLNYPKFAEAYQESVGDLSLRAGDPVALFALVAAGCQQMGRRILEETDQLGFNSLLRAMHEACQQPAFAAKVRAHFKAVIIDEFQDTDPLQWDIFRQLFPPSDTRWGRLFLVGDPKQSIYAFRQADIYTYLTAADDLGDHSRAHLDRNFRSEPSLINALNCLFDSAFAPNFIQLPRIGSFLDYVPVMPGGTVLDRDLNDGRGSVHAYIIVDKPKTEDVDQELFPYIAEEIRRLHVNEGLKLSKFAVLVADRHQAARLIKYLRTWNIAAAFQRSPSLAKSKSVAAMRELLMALINPRDDSALKIALGGPVIGWTHHRIRSLEQTEILQRVLEQFYRLRRVLWAHGFPSFFEELMSTSWESTGDTVEKKLLSQHEGVQFYNEWVQLADWIINRHHQKGAAPEIIIDELLELEDADDDRSDLQVQTTADENAVQVLTIHSSKGLEFDIVFPIGLYKRSKTPSTLILVPDGLGGYCQRAVDKKSQEYIGHCEEVDAEKMRQLYVAMTRAKHRLYLPFIFAKKDSRNKYGASPIELFAARCGPPIASYEELYARIEGNTAESFEAKLMALQSMAKITKERTGAEPIPINPLDRVKHVELVQPPLFDVPGTPLYLKSYTLLAKSSGHGSAHTLPPPGNFMAESKSPHTLPAGSEVGILLHAILEKISFAEARNAGQPEDLREFIRPFLSGSAFMAWEQCLAEIVFAAMKTPLFAGVAPLAEISDTECYREMEFVFPAGTAYEFDGYLKGVIDLIFRYQGKYYLVDWKSNWLGPDMECYGGQSMRQAMEANSYLLQAQIYREALRRYLSLVDEDVFGGTAYVFLRGLTPSTGIFCLPPQAVNTYKD